MELPKLSRWPVFSLLSQDFLQQVRLACVFGSAGNEAVVVCDDSEVYALGSNTSGCLGVGDLRSSLQPRKIETLCGKDIVHLTYGNGPHVLALTKDGELYSWGHNGYGQLGLGASVTTGQGTVPRKLYGVSPSKFVSVACGGHHTVAVTESGEAYSWGYNNCGQLGTGNTVNYTAPTRVGGALGNIMCVSASCGPTCSFTISRQGELYCWGHNGSGQLGISHNTDQHLPCKVKIPENTTVTQVVCGHYHTMCLSDECIIFTWGSNTSGQLGTGNKTNMSTPTPMAGDIIGRVVEIAASHNNNISGALTVSGKVFMWGSCRGQNVLLPLETNFTSLDEVFACFASPPCTWKPLSLDNEDASGLMSCIAGRFNDPNTSDVTFIVDGKKIHVHKAILRMRCEYFNSMFQEGRWSEAEKDTIEVEEYSHNIYYCFLKYLYTDCMDGLTINEAVEMLRLSDSYCERQLKRLCEKIIWQNMSVENVTYLMMVADKFKAESLMDYCFKFSCQHMTQVVHSEGYTELDGSLAKQLFVRAAENGILKT